MEVIYMHPHYILPPSTLATDWCNKLATTSPFILLLVDKQTLLKMVIIINPSTLQLTTLIQSDGIEHIFIYNFLSILILYLNH